MTYSERKALAAKRLANPSLYIQQSVDVEQQARDDVRTDRAIDRGLIAWWN